MKHIAEQYDLQHPPRLIILEGADSTGKTSLAKFLCRRMRAAYFKAEWFRQDFGAYCNNILDSAKETMEVAKLSVVLDRHWPSEHCYGPVLRPEEGRHSTGDSFSKIESMHGLYIFCFSDQAVDRQMSCSKHPYSRDIYLKVYDRYKELYQRLFLSGEHVTSYSVEGNGADLEGYYQRTILNEEAWKEKR